MKTDITIVLDCSGSMQSLKADIVGSFNAFLAEQQKLEDEAVITLTQFSDLVRVTYEEVPVREAAPLSDVTYVPGGGTALMDAIGHALRRAEERVKADDVVRLMDLGGGSGPSVVGSVKPVVVILTDGEENSSVNCTREQVFKEITRKRQEGWDVLFMGANQDAIAEAGKLGIGGAQALNLATRSGNIAAAGSVLGRAVSYTRQRTNSVGTYAYSQDDREKTGDD